MWETQRHKPTIWGSFTAPMYPCIVGMVHSVHSHLPVELISAPGGRWRLCGPSAFPEDGVLGLRCALAEVELIASGKCTESRNIRWEYRMVPPTYKLIYNPNLAIIIMLYHQPYWTYKPT